MELDLPNSHYVPIKSSYNFSELKKKNDINFSKDFDHDSDKVERRTLPLLIWNGQPNEDDDDDHQKRTTCEPCYQGIKEEKGLVGWPPIKSWRKKALNHEGGGVWNTNNIIDHRHINNDVVAQIRNSM